MRIMQNLLLRLTNRFLATVVFLNYNFPLQNCMCRCHLYEQMLYRCTQCPRVLKNHMVHVYICVCICIELKCLQFMDAYVYA